MYWQTGRLKQCQNSLHMYSRLKVIPLKLFYYQTSLLKLGVINIQHMNVKKMQ